MKTMKTTSQVVLMILLFWTGSADAQTDKDVSDLAAMLMSEQQKGASSAVIAEQAAKYWKSKFSDLSAKITVMPTRPDALIDLQEKYDRRAGNNSASDTEQIKNLTDEVGNKSAIASVGKITEDRQGALRALQGALSISLSASNGRTINDLLSVLSNQRQPTPIDLLVFRIFMEGNSGMGDNIAKLTDEQRNYSPADFARLAELAKHPNPVARLIAVEMLQYIPNAKEDATPALAAMMRGMKQEDNPAVINRIVDRANRQRSEVYKEVLPEISKTLEKSNPKIKEEALRVMKLIEEAR